VVALDGSKLSEGSIPHAVAMAECTGSKLLLLHVVEPVQDSLRPEGQPCKLDDQLESRRAHARAYLDRVRYRIAARLMDIGVAVEVGSPAETILDYARAHEADLIVMATHGLSGAKRWLLGGVANRVLARSDAPVLLVRVTP
jgi:nucleotide-binding universal stress UspA family protein